jgi:tripartite-type tricarboxylate transporter receptor subunit TctC
MSKRQTWKPLWLSVALGVASALPGPANAQPGEFVDGVLQPLEDGFPNRPITLISNDDAGSADGIIARQLQAILGDISPVPILVSDEPRANGGTFDKLKELEGRDGGTEGYYPVAVNVFGAATDTLVADIEGYLGMTLEDMHMVSVLEGSTMMVVQRKDAPWGPTFAGMVEYAKAHPGEIKYISTKVGSGSDIAFELIAKLAGIRQDLNKIPAIDVQAVVSTIGAGEGDVGIASTGITRSAWEDGRIDVTLSTLDYVPAAWDEDADVVTAQQAGLGQLGIGNFRGWCVPKATPKEHVEWLYKLLKAAASTDEYKKRETTVPGTRIMTLTPDESNQLAKDVVVAAEPVVRAVGLHWQQQQ